ncbi:MAG: hypothetical protein P4M12_10665 [Gammaproteobacteria bacterium]|nr:hypothetical protein [Gammaproteobacteria bacterium]
MNLSASMKIKMFYVALSLYLLGASQLSFANNNHLLTGTWSSVCAIGDDGKFLIETFVFKNNSAQYSVKSYEDTTCKNLLSTLVTERTFTLGDLIPHSDNIRKLNYIFKSVSMSFSNKSLVTTANSGSGYYGFNNWVINQAKDVSGLRKTSKSDKEHAKGDRFYTIVKIDKNNLYMGDYASGDGASEKTRLSSIYKVPFIRQDNIN